MGGNNERLVHTVAPDQCGREAQHVVSTRPSGSPRAVARPSPGVGTPRSRRPEPHRASTAARPRIAASVAY